ncbi:hypothetical protein ISS30_04520, partial [bacterium]|nr:hypothetical protein [bacterium]
MSSILIFFIVFAGILIVGIAAYRRTEWFLYLYLLGLPFDHVTFTVGPMRVSVSDFALVALLVSWLMRFFFKGEQRLCYPVQVYLGLMLMIFVVGATMRNFETIEGVRLSFSFIVKICSYFLLLQFIRNEKELTKSIKMIMIGAGLAT